MDNFNDIIMLCLLIIIKLIFFLFWEDDQNNEEFLILIFYFYLKKISFTKYLKEFGKLVKLQYDVNHTTSIIVVNFGLFAH